MTTLPPDVVAALHDVADRAEQLESQVRQLAIEAYQALLPYEEAQRADEDPDPHDRRYEERRSSSHAGRLLDGLWRMGGDLAAAGKAPWLGGDPDWLTKKEGVAR